MPDSILPSAPAEAPTPAPRTFILIIRSNGAPWGRTVLNAAAGAAGFDRGRAALQFVLPGELKAEPIAELHCDYLQCQRGELGELTLAMDLDKHSAHWRAFDSMVAAATRLAGQMGGSVFLADGRPATAAELKTSGDLVEAIHVARRDRAREASRIEMADGTFKELGYLPFVTVKTTPRGRCLEWNNFDVPAATRLQGLVDGQRAAKQLLDFIASFTNPAGAHVDLEAILADAFHPVGGGQRRRVRSGSGNASTAHAASAFIEVLEVALKSFAAQGYYAKWLDGKIAENVRQAELYDQHVAKQKAAFVERMRAARASKAAERDARRRAAVPRPANRAAARQPVKQCELEATAT